MRTVLGQEEGLFYFSITCAKPQAEKACKGDLFCSTLLGKLLDWWEAVQEQQKKKDISWGKMVALFWKLLRLKSLPKTNNWEMKASLWQPEISLDSQCIKRKYNPELWMSANNWFWYHLSLTQAVGVVALCRFTPHILTGATRTAQR